MNVQNPVLDVLRFNQSNLFARPRVQNVPSLSLTFFAKEERMDVLLEKAIAGFHLSNEAKGLSNRTITWYNSNLLLFQKWVIKELDHSPKFEEVTTENFAI